MALRYKLAGVNRNMGNPPFAEPQYLFQAAVGRSGSTILRRSIGLHPDIYYNGAENNLIQDVAEVAQRNCTRPSRVIAMQVDQPTYDAQFRRLICELTWPDQELAAARPIRFAAINPSAANLDYLCQIFPNSKIVCLVRNGLEVVCSRMKYQSFRDLEFQSHCQTWNRCGDMLDWGQRNPDRFFLFRHEWTYDSTLVEQKLNELFHWSGTRGCPAVANNIRDVIDCMPTTAVPKAFAEMSDLEKRSYFQAKANRCHHWTESQRQQFTEICGELMDRLGYEIPFPQIRRAGRAA